MNKIIFVPVSVASIGCIGKIKEYDVCVYGGTPGGITAAISAAREGASVVLLEQTRHVGGLSTSGLNRDEGNHLDRQTLVAFVNSFLKRPSNGVRAGGRRVVPVLGSPGLPSNFSSKC